MKKYFLFFITLFVADNFICAQNMESVHSYLDTLCAPGLHGRGAGFDGQKKAATYLADRFSEIGLLPLSNSYFQSFNYDINTFPGKLNLQVDGASLVPGKDYIIEASSPSRKATLKIVIADTFIFASDRKKKKFLNSDLKNSAVVYDERFSKLLKIKPAEFEKKIKEAACIIELQEKKLTMGLSSKQNENPTFQVLKEKFDLKAKTLSFEIEAALIKNYEAQNICGYVRGTAVPDSFLFITAHYDHLGSLGKATYFPGANDNGSGVSMLLELARHFKKNPPRYSIALIAFGAEEAGLIGSKYFTENPLVPLTKIRFLINLDLMGTGDDGMMVVNGSVFEKEFEALTKINNEKLYLTAIKKRGKAANSDHFFFTEKGVPAFFFYTLGGITAYHDVNDIPQTLPLTKFREVYQLIIDFAGMLDK